MSGDPDHEPPARRLTLGRRSPALGLLAVSAALAGFGRESDTTGPIRLVGPAPRSYPPGPCRICGKPNVRAGRERGDYRCASCAAADNEGGAA